MADSDDRLGSSIRIPHVVRRGTRARGTLRVGGRSNPAEDRRRSPAEEDRPGRRIGPAEEERPGVIGRATADGRSPFRCLLA
jgi:hypothetical protein